MLSFMQSFDYFPFSSDFGYPGSSVRFDPNDKWKIMENDKWKMKDRRAL